MHWESENKENLRIFGICGMKLEAVTWKMKKV